MSEIAASKARKRCAVYCRVSTDERLDQEFNSIDAQKEAGHAYIASQRTEGGFRSPTTTIDPGFSGGNTERPGAEAPAGRHRARPDRHRGGLQDRPPDAQPCRLLQDGRSVRAQRVSFVSVTQQFNTTTSMGRLMLNVLLSFAQFEREVTGERIRDKIAAAKRKGIWMGGVPPLGYDVENRLLVINEAEAAVVRRIFEEMLTIGSPTQIAANLNRRASRPRRGQRRRARPVAVRAWTRSTCTSCCATASTWASCRTRGTGTPAPTRRSSTASFGTRFTRCWPRTAIRHRWRPRFGRALTPCCAVCCTPLGRADVPDLHAQERAQVPLLRVQVGKPVRRAGQELRAPARAGDRGGSGRPDPHGADQPGVHRIGGAPHPAQRRSDRRSQYGDGDGAAQRRVGSVVPGRAAPNRQPDDRTDRPRPRRRGAGHQGEVAGVGLGQADR
jgi:DNA invertase Pin-like site-specific DNA recombinase